MTNSDSEDKFQIPILTNSNYPDWVIKMKSVLRSKGLYQLVIGTDEAVRDERGRYAKVDALRLDKAHAIIVTRIHSNLIARLTVDGAEDCPIQLWKNITSFGSSNKEANIFVANWKIKQLTLNPLKIDEFVSEFYSCVSRLRTLGVDVDERFLAHEILIKIPDSLKNVRDSIIGAGTTSSTPITYKMVLETLDSQVKANSTLFQNQIVKSEDNLIKSEYSPEALFTYKCLNGTHNPKAGHPKQFCFAENPDLRNKHYDEKKKTADSIKNPQAYLTNAFPKLEIHSEDEVSCDFL